MEKIIVRSPTRIDLAGGTLDLWPLYTFVNGAKTVNFAIDIWTTAEIEPLPGPEIEIQSQDLGLNKKYQNLKDCLKDEDPQVEFFRAQMRFWNPRKGFILKTSSMSPVGGGIGGSSSLTISIIRAMEKFCQHRINSVESRVYLAHNIEAKILNTPTGTQDYYPAASGGLNIIEYGFSGISHQAFQVSDPEFTDCFLLVYTGKQHHSGINNFEVYGKAVRKEEKTVKALWDLKVIADEMANACEAQHWQKFPDLFSREFEARIKLSPAFSSPEIERVAQVAIQAGAQAIKICGAGGGGCVMIWTKTQLKDEVSQACAKAGFQVLDANPVGLVD